jgi:hypothetical protein
MTEKFDNKYDISLEQLKANAKKENASEKSNDN